MHHPHNYKFLICYPNDEWKVITTKEIDVLYRQVNEVLALAEKYSEDNIRRVHNDQVTQRIHN